MTHPQLYQLYGTTLAEALRQAGFTVEPCMVRAGERSKSLLMASRLYTQLAKRGADRQSIICALGGGVIGDLSGFVAATYMRGIPFVQIPTSLLAMVDSSIGGKTGVNHPLGKNLIGAFYPPRAVFTDIALLQSLPEREYLCGLSEIVKAGAIGDPELFCLYRRRISSAIRQRHLPVLTTLIERSIAVKVRWCRKIRPSAGCVLSSILATPSAMPWKRPRPTRSTLMAKQWPLVWLWLPIYQNV